MGNKTRLAGLHSLGDIGSRPLRPNVRSSGSRLADDQIPYARLLQVGGYSSRAYNKWPWVERGDKRDGDYNQLIVSRVL